MLTATTVFAQISLHEKNVNLEVVLNKIEAESDYVFLYNNINIDNNQKVSIETNNESIESVLSKLFSKSNISYTVSDKQIILTSKSDQSKQNSESKRKISGEVKDAVGEPLIGVSVIVDGEQTGTVTDYEGNFSINASSSNTVLFSYLGYKSKKVAIENKMILKVVLDEDSQLLDEVVVTALGIKRETKALTYNVQQLKADDIAAVKSPNILSNLAGKVAGVTINESASGTGGSTRVVMRGTKSLFGENNALFVLDGIPLQGLRAEQPNSLYESPSMPDSDGMSSINPDDIESVSVLTGASAAALYGHKGANGVILITTKKGSPDKLKVSYSNGTSFSKPFILPKFQNTYGRNDGEFRSWGEKMENPSNYSPKDFFQTGYSTMNSVSISTGTETHQTYLSVGSTNSEGIIKKDNYDRYNFSLRNNNQLIKNVLEMDLSVYYIKSEKKNGVSQGLYYNPLVPVYLFPPQDDFKRLATYELHNPERNFPTQYWEYGNQGVALQNPYWITNRNVSQSKQNRYMLGGSMKWNMTNWLNVVGRIRYDRSNTGFNRKLYASTDPLLAESKGHYWEEALTNRSLYADIMASVDKSFGHDFRFTANAGASIYDEKMARTGYKGNLLAVPNYFHYTNINQSAGTTEAIKSDNQSRTNSMFARAELGYKNFAYLEATSRMDYFSQLQFTNQEWVFYPSVGISTLISEILPLPENILSLWKVRASYAEVGTPPDVYLTKDYYNIKGSGLDSAGTLGNENLEAEKTKSFEVGLDMNFFYNKLRLSATYYNTNTFNQLFKYELPASTGYQYAYANAGKVNNFGLEVSLAYNMDLGPVNWETNLTYTINKNKIKELLPEYIYNKATDSTVKAPEYFLVASGESYQMRLTENGTMGDIYATTLKQDQNGDIWVNPMTGAIEVDANNYKKVGSTLPKYNIGFSNTFSWKGLSLNFLIDARVGGVVVSGTQAMMDQFGTSQATADARDRGGVNVNMGKLGAPQYYEIVAGGKTGLLGHYVYSATNVRLRNLSVSYKVPKKWSSDKLDVTLSLTGKNLIMFHNKAPFDPDLTASTSTYYQGFDYFMQPSTKSLGFGVKVNF